MTPSAGASTPSIARWEKCGRPWMPSSVQVPGSIRSASRSRAVSFSAACCFSIFSGPPPCSILRRRSCNSSTSGRSTEVGASVADMGSFLEGVEQRLDHPLDGGGAERALELVERRLEVRDLEADDLATLRNAAQQLAQLGDLQAVGRGEQHGQLVLLQDVEVQVDVHRVVAEHRDQVVAHDRAALHDGDALLVDQL